MAVFIFVEVFEELASFAQFFRRDAAIVIFVDLFEESGEHGPSAVARTFRASITIARAFGPPVTIARTTFGTPVTVTRAAFWAVTVARWAATGGSAAAESFAHLGQIVFGQFVCVQAIEERIQQGA